MFYAIVNSDAVIFAATATEPTLGEEAIDNGFKSVHIVDVTRGDYETICRADDGAEYKVACNAISDFMS